MVSLYSEQEPLRFCHRHPLLALARKRSGFVQVRLAEATPDHGHTLPHIYPNLLRRWVIIIPSLSRFMGRREMSKANSDLCSSP